VFHTGSGRVVYDPKRPGLKKRKDWWCVILVDREITRYYRWWVESQLHVKGMCQPSWDAHISIVRGERPEKHLLHLWKKYDNNIMEFQYSHNVYSVPAKDGGHFWMVDVKCDDAMNIRTELQLSLIHISEPTRPY